MQIGDLQSFPLLPDLPVFSDFKKAKAALLQIRAAAAMFEESVEFGDEAEAPLERSD